jgi:hypothetical protein
MVRTSWVAYKDINDTEIVLGCETAPSADGDGWRVDHFDWVELQLHHPLLQERLSLFVEDLPQDDPFSVEESELFCRVLAQAIDVISGEMSEVEAFTPRWEDDAKSYANEVVVRVESNLLDTVTEPLYIVAAGLDYLLSALERLRQLAYERKSLTILISVPEDAPLADLDEAVRRRHALSLRDVYLDVIKERDVRPSGHPSRWLPSPIAVPLAMSRNSVTAQRRFTSIRAFVEGTFKMLALLAAAPCTGRTLPERMEAAAIFLEKKSPLTLGDAMKRVEKHSPLLKDLLPKTMSMLSDAGGQGGQATVMKAFAEFRNDDAHGPPSSEATYASKFLDLQEHLEQLVAALCSDWESLAIVVPLATQFDEDDQIVYQLADLCDDRIVPAVSRTISNAHLVTGHVYLRSTSAFVDLHPLFLFQACPKCEFEEVFLLEKAHPSAPVWRSGRGHKINEVNSVS